MNQRCFLLPWIGSILCLHAFGGEVSEDRVRVTLNVQDLRVVPGHSLTVHDIASMLRQLCPKASWTEDISCREDDGDIIVVQTPDTLKPINDLLASLRAYMAALAKVEAEGGGAPAKPLSPALVPSVAQKRAQSESRTAELNNALKAEVSFRYTNTPLREVLDDLSKKIKAPIILDPRAGTAKETSITLHGTRLRADVALKRVLAHAEERHSGIMGNRHLKFIYRDHAVCVCAIDADEPDMILSLYYVRDLSTVLECKGLASLIKDDLFSEEFRNPATSIQLIDGALLVVQTPQVQDRINAFLTYFRLHADDDAIVASKIPGFQEADEAVPPDLEKLVDAEFQNTDLLDALDKLQETSGVTILYPEWLKRFEGVSGKVTVKLAQVPLRTALAEVLKPSRMLFILKDGAVNVIVDPIVGCGIYRVDGFKEEMEKWEIRNLHAGRNKEQSPIEQWVRGAVPNARWFTLIKCMSNRVIVQQTPEWHHSFEEVLKKRNGTAR